MRVSLNAFLPIYYAQPRRISVFNVHLGFSDRFTGFQQSKLVISGHYSSSSGRHANFQFNRYNKSFPCHVYKPTYFCRCLLEHLMKVSNKTGYFVNDIFYYRMAKIYCHINQCDESVQYFAILHADKYCTLSRKPITLKIHSL